MKHEFFVAGVKFHELHTVIAVLKKGDCFELVPEPDNIYDSNAVALKFNGTMCGYVPKTLSAEVTAAIDVHGAENVVCEIIHLDRAAKPWEQCSVEVKWGEEKTNA